MKKAAKIFLIIAIVLVVLGMTLIVGAFAAAGFDLAKFEGIEGEYTEQTVDIEGEGVAELVLDDLSRNNLSYEVTLIPSKDPDFHITYAAYISDQADTIRWMTENGSLRISSNESSRKNPLNIISFGFDQVPLTIEVPASVKVIRCDVDAAEFTCEGLALDGDLICSSDAATMEIRDVDVKGTISLDGDAADVSMEHITIGDLNVSCDFGSVQMEDITVGDVMIESDTCDIELTSVFAQGILDLSADFGSIMMSSVSADTVSVKADTCDVDFASLGCEKALVFDVSFGDISGTIDDSQNSFTVFTKVDFGDSNLSYGGNGSKTLDATVDTGNIDIQFLK